MLRAIIVDDEELVRHGLQYHYHWEKYDIQICGDFPDGKLALEYLSEHPVDLLVTDVVMPHLNGLELAKKAREMYPDLKIIFISGYADVNYLGDALRMNAVDYIFKSIDFDALDAAIERVADVVQRRNSEIERQRWLEKQLDLNREVLRQQRLVALIGYTEESEEMLAKGCAALALPLNNQSNYVVMVTQISNRWTLLSEKESGKSDLMLDLSLQNALQECLQKHQGNVVFKKRSYEYITIINADTEEYEELLLTVSAEIKLRLKHLFDAEAVIGISQRFRGLKQIRSAYKGACDAIYNRYLLDSSMPDIAMNKYPMETNLISVREKIKTEVNRCILDGDSDQIHRVVVGCVNAVRTIPSIDEQYNMLIDILLLPQKLLRDVRPCERACYSSHRKLLEQFLVLRELHEQEEFIIRSFSAAAEVLKNKNSLHNNVIVKRVESYIDSHYMEPLSIEGLAESVYLTPTYLCVLFKKYTGKTINNYLTEVRLEKAKELLRMDNLHLQDVCYKVGYLSPSYFSKLFRKYYGQTPSEYRESSAIENQ